MQIRRVTRTHAAAAYSVTSTALLMASMTPATLAERLAGWDGGRSWGAFDGDALVGHARAVDLVTTVPGGGKLPTAGVTSVGVLPTHTRRGALRGMMTALLHHERARGAVLASLRASQAPIYGRFGFGLAGSYADYELVAGSRLRTDARPRTHTTTLLPLRELRRVVPELHARIGCAHVGAVERLSGWWDRLYGHLRSDEVGHARWVVGAVAQDGSLDGYLDMALDDLAGFDPNRHRMAVTDLFAGNADAYRALWAHVLATELVGTIVARRRPVDERLRWLLEDPRALRTTAVNDEQWVRLLDVRAALAARTYQRTDVSVVLAVHDELLPDNAGRHRIGGAPAATAPSGGTGGRDDGGDGVDLELDVAELGALYLGGASAVELVAAGRIVQHRAGAAADADLLLRVTPAPWCGSFF